MNKIKLSYLILCKWEIFIVLEQNTIERYDELHGELRSNS